MSLTVTIESAPHPQTRMTITHLGGETVIGRGEEADLRINDPEMFVSRKHCVITGEDGTYRVTDCSSGGLFLDGSVAPLGAGAGAALQDGMTLRLGDVILRVAVGSSTVHPMDKINPMDAGPAQRTTNGFDWDDDPFFATKERVEETPTPRPDKPDPFETFSSVGSSDTEPGETAPLPAFDDPFSLGPEPKKPIIEQTRAPEPTPVIDEAPQAKTTAPAVQDGRLDAGYAAILTGMGLDPDQFSSDDPAADLEALGKRFRLMADGLTHLLRNRTREQQDAGLPVTTIGAQQVNPLKFLPTTEDALSALVVHRGEGYLDPDAAIIGGFRDIATHNINAWRGIQSALRRMVDRFDPQRFEAELEEAGLVDILVAGGKSAKLWQLYQEQYRAMAEAAETRFLGEIGTDFRDAFEKEAGT